MFIFWLPGFAGRLGEAGEGAGFGPDFGFGLGGRQELLELLGLGGEDEAIIADLVFDQGGVVGEQVQRLVGLHEADGEVGVGLVDLDEGVDGQEVELVVVAGGQLLFGGKPVHVELAVEVDERDVELAEADVAVLFLGDGQAIGPVVALLKGPDLLVGAQPDAQQALIPGFGLAGVKLVERGDAAGEQGEGGDDGDSDSLFHVCLLIKGQDHYKAPAAAPQLNPKQIQMA